MTHPGEEALLTFHPVRHETTDWHSNANGCKVHFAEPVVPLPLAVWRPDHADERIPLKDARGENRTACAGFPDPLRPHARLS